MIHLSRKRALAPVLAMWLLQAGSASALSLIQAYEAARQNDPTYRMAVYENEVGQQYKELGRSGLLPSLSASFSSGRNKSDLTTPDMLGNISTIQRNYSSRSSVIQLRQTLFNLDSAARYYQGVAQTNYSDAQFSGRGQELIVRLVSAYVEAKYAEEQLALMVVQRDAYAERRRVNDRMFEKGEGTKTDMLETQAKLDLAEAQVLEAKDKLTDARNALVALVGQEVTALDALRDDFRVKPMQPSSFDEWKTIALEHNQEIIAKRLAVEMALQEINKGRAGHMPRLDFVASVSDTYSDTSYTINQDINTASISLQLNMPLYSGGYVTAITSQAVSNHEKAKADLDDKIGQVLIELRKNYSLILSSTLRLDALENSVDSARMLVEATQKSIGAGMRTNLDLLNAQQQLFAAKRDLSQARNNYLLYYLKLRQAAGVVDMGDLREVAGYFVADPQ